MIIISGESGREAVPAGALIALGCFDGLHLGHLALLRNAAEAAGRMGIPFGVWSPRGAKKAPALYAPEEKAARLEELGASFYAEEDFARVKDMTAREFFEGVLIGRYRAAALACGANFSFGRGREGDAQTLGRFCGEAGIPLYVTETLDLDGEPVSSAAVRRALREGDPGRAEKMLGRPYGFHTEVAEGRHVGRTLGYPTLNLPFPGGMAPELFCRGVYAAAVTFEGGARYRAVMNVGVHPTFGEAPAPLCEAHLLDAPEAGDCYGKRVYLEFYAFLREERVFKDERELSRAIGRDEAAARGYFDGRKETKETDEKKN